MEKEKRMPQTRKKICLNVYLNSRKNESLRAEFIFVSISGWCQMSYIVNNMTVFNDIQSIGVDQSNLLMCLSTFFSWNFLNYFFFHFVVGLWKRDIQKILLQQISFFFSSCIEVVCMPKNAQINEGIWLLFFWGNCFMCSAFQIY